MNDFIMVMIGLPVSIALWAVAGVIVIGSVREAHRLIRKWEG